MYDGILGAVMINSYVMDLSLSVSPSILSIVRLVANKEAVSIMLAIGALVYSDKDLSILRIRALIKPEY